MSLNKSETNQDCKNSRAEHVSGKRLPCNVKRCLSRFAAPVLTISLFFLVFKFISDKDYWQPPICQIAKKSSEFEHTRPKYAHEIDK